MANKYFHESNRKTKYGEHDVKFWIGTVVAFASQQKQIEEGFGWMYKVRVDGDHAVGADSIKDEQLSYAYCILPTTAGSGGAFKLRSVRISQGDTVFGVRGGGKNAPHFIIGVFPRTRLTKNSSGNFGMLSGFFGSLKKNKTLSGEFNDQIGPATPGVTPVDPKNYNKAIAKEPSKQVAQLGIDPNDNKPIENIEELLTPPTTDPNKKWIPAVASGNVKLEDGTIVKDTDVILTGNETDSEIAKKIVEAKTTDTIEVITEGGLAATVPAGTNLNGTGTVPVTVIGPLGNPITIDKDISTLRRPEPITNGQIKKLLSNTSADDIIAVVDGITPKIERKVDSNTGLYIGQSAHQYQGGVAEYWKKIESQRELNEREKRYKNKNKDQYGRSLENESQQFKIVDSVAYERVKAENGTYVYESQKPAVSYKREYKSYVVAAISQAVKQDLIDSEVARSAQILVGSGDFEGALNLIYPPPPPVTT